MKFMVLDNLVERILVSRNNLGLMVLVKLGQSWLLCKTVVDNSDVKISKMNM